MRYFSFILNKIRRNKLNIIPFVLITAFIVFIYYGSCTSAFRALNDPIISGEENIEGLEKDVNRFKTALANSDESSDYYKMMQRDLSTAQQRLDYLKQRRIAIDNGDWHEYYKNDLELKKLSLSAYEKNMEYQDKKVIETMELNIDYTQYMADHNMGFDRRSSNIQGVSYMGDVLSNYVPILLVVFLIYMISPVYCSTYKDDMDIQNLLPISKLKRQGSRLLSGAVIGAFIVLFICIMAIISGIAGNTVGNFDSPILSYTMQGYDSFIPFINVLPQVVALLSLSILLLVNLVSVVSIFARKNMTCLLVSLVLVLGFLAVFGELAPLKPYIHLFPTTYLNSLKVVSGQLAFLANNTDVNFLHGVIILGFSNTILFLLYYFLPNSFAKRVKKS